MKFGLRTKNRNFTIYYFGRSVSLLGSGIQSLALSLYILDITGSGRAMSTFLVISILPKIIFAPLAGVLGDRIKRKSIMVNLDLLRGAIILFMCILTFNGHMGITYIYLFQLIISTIDIFFDPVTRSILPDIVKESDLIYANSIVNATDSLSYVIGPILGGVLYPIGMGFVFLVNSVTFIASGISEIFIDYKKSSLNGKLTMEQVWKDFKNGLIALKRLSGVLRMMSFITLTNLIMGPVVSLVVPFFAREVAKFDSYQYSIISSSWLVGITLGNIILSAIVGKLARKKIVLIGLLLQLIFFYIFCCLSFPWFVSFFGERSWAYILVLTTLFAAIGFFNAFVNTPVGVYFQMAAPSEIRTRVLSVIALIAQISMPVGMALYGFVIDRFPAHLVILFSLILTTCITLFYSLTNSFELLESEQKYDNP